MNTAVFLKIPFFLVWVLTFKTLYSQPKYTYIDPFIGSEGKGNVFIGPSCPFGMVKPGPDCSTASNSGYVADTMQTIYGFSHIHVSGTGGGPKYGNILVMPFMNEFTSIKLESLRSHETASAGYYSVLLTKWNIATELTTSPKVAFHRYIFKNKGNKGVKIDLGTFLGEQPIPDSREAQQFVGSEIEIVSPCELRGYTRIRGGWNNGSAYTVYFYARFNRNSLTSGTWKSTNIMPGIQSQFDSGEKTGAYLNFGDSGSDTVELKVGISFISTLKARQNLENEIPHWDFNLTLRETQNRWENLLNRLDIDADADQKKMFYTALYHTMLMPVDRTGDNPLWNSPQPYFDDFYAIWDTYRSSHPLITLISPAIQTRIVNAMIDIYKNDGYLPEARSGNCNGRTQGGSNAEVMIADAYVKGLKGINYGQALMSMLKDATIPPGGNEEKEGRGGLDDYNRLGYVSTNYVRSGNRTVEYAYNDYCLAMVAKGLNRKGEYRRFIKQSDNWQNLWRNYEDHGATGFIMPRDASGKWVDSILCDEYNGRRNYIPYTPLAQDWPVCVCWWCGFFYEASSWEYSFFVPHDVAKLIEKCGGNNAFLSRLNTFFDNHYYNVGNEPSFLTSCLYHWIGRPDLSSQRTREIILNNYNTSRNGIPGNDDSGAMSSWLAFHLMGLYPNAGQSYYLITAPFWKQTVLHQENGRDFKITAKNLSDKNRCIRTAYLNGKPYPFSWIEHSDIVAGGELVLEMAPTPSSWGTGIAPPSKNSTVE